MCVKCRAVCGYLGPFSATAPAAEGALQEVAVTGAQLGAITSSSQIRELLNACA